MPAFASSLIHSHRTPSVTSLPLQVSELAISASPRLSQLSFRNSPCTTRFATHSAQHNLSDGFRESFRIFIFHGEAIRTLQTFGSKTAAAAAHRAQEVLRV